MKTLSLLLISFLLTNNSFASWFTLNSGTTINLNDTYFFNSDSGFAVGDSGIIIKTTDGGVNWSPINSNAQYRLAAVFFTDSVNGYIVGDSCSLLKTNDGGINWVRIPLGLPANTSFSSIYFSNDSTGYISSNPIESISKTSVILRTTDKWLSWEVDTFGIGAVSSIFFPSNDTGYLAGNCLRKTTNAGEEWQLESYKDIKLNSVTHNSYNLRIVAVGDSGKIAYGQPGTSAFSVISPGTTEKLNHIIFDSFYHYYFVVGDHGTLFRNDDSTPITAWTQVNVGVTSNLHSISIMDQSDFSNLIVGDSGTILKTVHGGPWFQLTSGTTNNLYSLAGNHGPNQYSYAVGDSGTILRIKDTLVTPKHLGLTNKKLNSICYFGNYSGSHGYYIVGEKGTMIYTTDEFLTATIQNIDSSIDLTYIHFFNPSNSTPYWGFACGFDNARNESVILYTVNGGVTWQKNYTGFTTKLKGGCDQDNYIVGENGAILDAPYQYTPTGHNFKHWIQYNSLAYTDTLGSVFFTSNNTGYALNRGSNIIKTNDGGKNWTLLSANNSRSVFFTDQNTGYASGINSRILKTISSGNNWTLENYSNSDGLNRVFFPNPFVGFAVGENGKILKTWMITVDNQTICAGDTATLIVYGNGISYNWSTGDSGSTILVAPDSTTSYTVTGHSADGFTDTKVAVVTVIQEANVTISIDSSVISPGQSATLCASGCVAYSWDTGQNAPCITVSPSTTTTYTVIGIDQCGNADTSTQVVTVLTNNVSNGNTSNNESEFQLFPIPATDKLTLSSSKSLSGNFFIFDAYGQEVINQSFSGIQTEINLSNFSAGIYFIQLITDKKLEIRKIIKQ